MSEEEYIGLVYKKLKLEIDPAEIKILDQLSNENPDLKKLRDEIEVVWHLSEAPTQIEIDVASDLGKLTNKIQSATSKGSETDKPNKTSVSKYLVLLLLIAGVSTIAWFLNSQQNSHLNFMTENSQRQISLEDGSIINLNSETHIEIQNSFNKENRLVKLTGEAFFNVQKNESLPFEIIANGHQIKVVGTQFNVNTENDKMYVSVQEGIVQLNNKDSEVILKAGDLAVSNGINDKIQLYSLNQVNAKHWQSNRIYYKNQSLENVISELELLFDSQINLDNQNLKDCKVSFTTQYETLSGILEVLSLSLGADVKKVSDNIYSINEGQCQ